MNEIRGAEAHHLIAGELCVDFANTLYGHSDAPIHEYLLDYRDLVLWGRHAGILTEKKRRADCSKRRITVQMRPKRPFTVPLLFAK